jgi:hypothetical protein
VIFAHADATSLRPGEPVVVQMEPHAPETLAIVIIGSGQLVEDAVEIEPSALVLRMASDADIASLAGPPDEELDPARRAATKLAAAGMPSSWDSWITPARDEPVVTLATHAENRPTASDFIARRFADSESLRRPPRPTRNS